MYFCTNMQTYINAMIIKFCKLLNENNRREFNAKQNFLDNKIYIKYICITT